jgi:hypothetical protein
MEIIIMKQWFLSIIIIAVGWGLYADETRWYDDSTPGMERIYMVKLLAFHDKFEVYCTLNQSGYYRYREDVLGREVYVTYETRNFIRQSRFDENMRFFEPFHPMTMWSLASGEVTRLKRRYGPVIDKNRERKGYPYGFGKN